ncbi:ABC transporter ATP-binding protein [Xylocopilactobacillus apicola]|uniref:Peptide ABC transporter ATP-binding protein n=1 Tax=Xylocopilactobacillus apicola TaxID=2932184 RepID=A0AAU9D6P1_9LACO|nr:ATP-binding cassette domain-containing protein [Xylocopilactobacillus apicola]BDR59218.1 peptide ABC transporter ATP-binding protein [Xylocopilactobacillus apicola]
MTTPKKILQVEHLKQYFNVGKANEVKAVDDVSFDIYEGETFGLVGESGSGKSTTGRSIIRLYQPTSGKITFDGQDVCKIKNHGSEILNFRRSIQMIFQDPYASLDPRMKVKDIIAEGLDVHHLAKSDQDRTNRVKSLLKVVGLNPDHLTRYPHEFSGGQRQRIGIARALAVDPKFIIADEPISALDVSIQAQVVNLMKEIQQNNNLTYLFIAHDLSMVKYISDRIAVMHLGHLMELGTADDVYNHPLHPYTKSLLSAIPLPDPEVERKRQQIPYDSSIERKGDEKRELREVVPGHFVYSTVAEVAEYQKEAQR